MGVTHGTVELWLEEDYPLSPVFTQEFVSDTQSQLSSFAPLQSTQGSAETGRKVRASFTALGLALSLGATGSLISSAEAADSVQLAALPSVTGAHGTLPSFGSSRPEGAAATYHTVADGETIWDIAKYHGVSVEAIKAANGIGGEQVIQAGQVLKVPTPSEQVVASLQPAAVLEIPQPQASPAEEVEVLDTHEATLSDEDEELAPAANSSVPTSLAELLAAQESARDSKQIAALAETEAPTDEVLAPEIPVFEDADAAPTSKADAEDVSEIALLPRPQIDQDFQTQLEWREQPSLERADVTSSEPPTAVRTVPDEWLTHEVNRGETVWSIARSYGVKPEVLQQANAIANPNFIVSGDELVIPVDESPRVAQELTETWAAAANQLTVEAPANKRLIAVGGVETEEEAIASPEERREQIASADLAAQLDTQSIESSVSEASAAEAVVDPFVEDLLSEVAQSTQPEAETATRIEQYSRAISKIHEQAVAAEDATGAVEVAAPEAEAVAVNPEFSATEPDTVADIEVGGFRSEELLAAAPLGSEVYAPVIESPEGRVVTPDMPVMPGQDEYLPEAPNRFNGFIWPAQGVLTSGYGWRWGRMHQGVDIAGPVGTPIYAAAPGVVVSSGWNSGGYGNMVDIRHPDGSTTRYAHNSRLMVSAGQQVRQGQQIAEMGSTGYSTGPHLHFEIRLPSQGAVNPIAHLPNR